MSMKVQIELSDLDAAISTAVASAITDHQTKLFGWKYYTLKETAELLQVKPSTVLDKRMPYLTEVEYSQNGKTFWFKKDSVENFIN
jgi:hypothetical protein